MVANITTKPNRGWKKSRGEEERKKMRKKMRKEDEEEEEEEGCEIETTAAAAADADTEEGRSSVKWPFISTVPWC